MESNNTSNISSLSSSDTTIVPDSSVTKDLDKRYCKVVLTRLPEGEKAQNDFAMNYIEKNRQLILRKRLNHNNFNGLSEERENRKRKLFNCPYKVARRKRVQCSHCNKELTVAEIGLHMRRLHNIKDAPLWKYDTSDRTFKPEDQIKKINKFCKAKRLKRLLKLKNNIPVNTNRLYNSSGVKKSKKRGRPRKESYKTGNLTNSKDTFFGVSDPMKFRGRGRPPGSKTMIQNEELMQKKLALAQSVSTNTTEKTSDIQQPRSVTSPYMEDVIDNTNAEKRSSFKNIGDIIIENVISEEPIVRIFGDGISLNELNNASSNDKSLRTPTPNWEHQDISEEFTPVEDYKESEEEIFIIKEELSNFERVHSPEQEAPPQPDNSPEQYPSKSCLSYERIAAEMMTGQDTEEELFQRFVSEGLMTSQDKLEFRCTCYEIKNKALTEAMKKQSRLLADYEVKQQSDQEIIKKLTETNAILTKELSLKPK